MNRIRKYCEKCKEVRIYILVGNFKIVNSECSLYECSICKEKERLCPSALELAEMEDDADLLGEGE